MTVEEMKRYGYCITSRKHRLASRIDSDKWRSVMDGMGITPDADYYRRCISKDTIVVTAAVAKKLKPSGAGYIEFRSKPCNTSCS